MANEFARSLRKNQTDAERKLWSALRSSQISNHRFRRQHPMGPYIVDFICLEKKLIIELDGSQHADGDQKEHDEKRDQWLEARGYKVIRFWNADIVTNLDGVLTEIMEHLWFSTAAPPPP